MSKDPAFLFYSSDFLTGTMFFSDEQIGRYIKLLCAQHQKGRLNKKDMLNICKTYDQDIFDKFKTDKNGLYYNERLENEVERRKKYSESRRKNRQSKPKIADTSKTYVPHMETETETETINEIETEVLIWPTFEDFWIMYDKKVGDKKKIKKKWDKLKQMDKEIIMDYLPMYKGAEPNKKFRKNPETFLNNESWNDELIINNDGKGNKKGFTERVGQYYDSTDPNFKNL